MTVPHSSGRIGNYKIRIAHDAQQHTSYTMHKRYCFYGLDYAFVYACFYDTSMGHYTWDLVACNELYCHYLPSAQRVKPEHAGVVAQQHPEN
jgi:hypothetical protein